MGVLAAILSTIALGLLINEAQAFQPLLQRTIVKIALALLTPARRERYREEWPSTLQGAPGEMTRTLWALWFISAGLMFRIGDGLNYLKPQLMRYMPILDERQLWSMWFEDVMLMIKAPEVTVLDYKNTRIGEKTTQMEIHMRVDNLTGKELAKKLGLSRASDPWQLSPAVKLLRRGYGLLTKSRKAVR
jgi:hypothetical protein